MTFPRRSKAFLPAILACAPLVLVATLPASAASGAGAGQSAPAKAQPVAPPPVSSTDALDSMTRDGGASDAGHSAADAADSQSMNVGGAVVRTLLALGLVLALVVGAIRFLKRRGYGVAAQRHPADTAQVGAPSKPQFGVSPLAQMLLAARPQAQATPASQPPAIRNAAAQGIDGFELLGSASLPGSVHTLYKVRVGERVLLLGGAPSGALNVLTEWDVETSAETDTHFEALLDEMQLGQMPPRRAAPLAQASAARSGGNDTLQTAASRLSEAVRRASAAASFDTCTNSGQKNYR